MSNLLVLLSIITSVLLQKVEYSSSSSGNNVNFEIDDHALVLTDQNWDHAHSIYKYILVFFYKPDCENCEYYDDIFVKAAKKANEMNHDVKFGFVNTSQETGIRTSEEIENYPSIKFYRNGTGVEYLNTIGPDHIVKWLTKRVQYQLKPIKTQSEAIQTLTSHYLVAFGCILSKKVVDVQEFEIVSGLHDDIEFGLIQDPELCTQLGMSPNENSMSIHQHEFDIVHRMTGKELTRTAMNQFIEKHHVPIFAEHSDFIFTKSFVGHYHFFVTIVYKTLPIPLNQFKAEIRSIAQELDGKVVFIHFDLKKTDNHQFLSHVNVPLSEGWRVIESNQHLVTFVPDQPNNLNGTYMLQFIQNVMAGKVKSELRASEPPKDWHKELVKPLVQSTFDHLAQDHKKTVFVLMYSPECKFSREIMPVIDELANHYKDNDEVEFAKFDTSTDEHPRIRITATPTMFMYLKGSNEKIEFHGERTFANIKKFIESHGKHGNERQYLEVNHLQHIKMTNDGLKHSNEL